jgi:hypothetical protein
MVAADHTPRAFMGILWIGSITLTHAQGAHQLSWFFDPVFGPFAHTTPFNPPYPLTAPATSALHVSGISAYETEGAGCGRADFWPIVTIEGAKMGQKSGRVKEPAELVVKEIRRALGGTHFGRLLREKSSDRRAGEEKQDAIWTPDALR